MPTGSNTTRIAKNTLLLYFRMLLTMGVSLYTSRVILNALGVEDYGIYNVVGGVVAMVSFVSWALTTGTQRHISTELGKKDGNLQKRKYCNEIQASEKGVCGIARRGTVCDGVCAGGVDTTGQCIIHNA